MADEYCVYVKNISKRFAGVTALDGVELAIKPNHIHCLAGENGSGKSTLIKILSGALQPEEGAYLEIDGKSIHTMTSIESIQEGIAVIYQDLSLFPNLSVAENITAERNISEKRKLVNKREIFSIAREVMRKLSIRLPLDETVERLSIGDQQLVAICRALTRDLKLLIMDEPTAALTRKEVNSLFSVIKDLQKKGISTLFVSHKLDEVFEISEEVTIIRDGKVIGTYPVTELDGGKLTFLMTGKKLTYSKHIRACDEDSSLLRLERLTKRDNYRDIDLCLAAGEIVGITGLLGSGRTELALSLFGMNKPDSGNIFMGGREVEISSVRSAMKLGIGYVPENRLLNGLIMNQSVGKNIIITILKKLLNRLGLIDGRKSGDSMKNWVDELAIKVPGIDAEVRTLSGGNQQRVVIAKWLATDPKVLILDGPTVGIDVAAKESIHGIVRRLSEKGLGILLISDEVSEVYNNCDRVIVMHKGRFIEEFNTADVREHEIQDCINRRDEGGTGKIMKKIFALKETYLVLVVAVLIAVITIVNRSFFTLENLFDLLKSYSFLGIFAMGVLVVLVSGGIDISFTAVATVAQYVMAVVIIRLGGNMITAFAVAVITGMILGFINALLIYIFNIPTIITTIATLNIFYGLLIVFSGGKWIYSLPDWFRQFAEVRVFTLTSAAGTPYGLSLITLLWFGAIAVTFFILRFTTLGRNIYAMGGNLTAAKRIGFNIFRLQVFVYIFMGFMAGAAGVVQALLVQMVAPNSIVGKELDVLAAVVLGGANLAGGSGTIAGTLLGVSLIAILGNGMTLMRIPSYWYNVFIGLVIIFSVGLSAYRVKKRFTRSIEIGA